MKTKWNGKEIRLLDVKRIDNATVKTGNIRLQLIGVDLMFEILTSDKSALRLLDCASCKIIRCDKQPADCNALFKTYPGAVSPFGWRKESFTRGNWAEYPSPDHAWHNDIAECDITAGKATFRALVSVQDTAPKTKDAAARNCEIRKATLHDYSVNAMPEKGQDTTATPTAELETEIIRILSRDFTHLKARPTATEFYQEYVINARSMAGLARAKKWSERTMKFRKAEIEKHLSRQLKTSVDLDELRTAHRKAGKIVYVDPGRIEKTYSEDMEQNED